MMRDELALFCADDNIDYAEGDHEGRAGIFFHWNNPNNPADGECLHVTHERLAALTWPELRKLIINGRDVVHMTRIVGYFSRIENWNKSKKGELKDRHKGRYSVEAAAHA